MIAGQRGLKTTECQQTLRMHLYDTQGGAAGGGQGWSWSCQCHPGGDESTTHHLIPVGDNGNSVCSVCSID